LEAAARRAGIAFYPLAPEEAGLPIDPADSAVAERVDRREELAYAHIGRAKLWLLRSNWPEARLALAAGRCWHRRERHEPTGIPKADARGGRPGQDARGVD
jgi:hypothetical protein